MLNTFFVQGLLKVAIDNARAQEKQVQLEKTELKMDFLRERELRETLEKQLAMEQKNRGTCESPHNSKSLSEIFDIKILFCVWLLTLIFATLPVTKLRIVLDSQVYCIYECSKSILSSVFYLRIGYIYPYH